ncbi:hypothetical protein KUTeg_021889, partial [Tegillarca granosa]
MPGRTGDCFEKLLMPFRTIAASIRYGGFCPQFKYKIGETFGKTTSKLLKSKDVASSGKLVLADIKPERPGSDPTEDARATLLQSRLHSWGDQKLVERMVPGYTGFIPRSQHYFGNRYAVNCKSAISDFESDHLAHESKMEELKITDALQSGKQVLNKDGKKLPSLKTRHLTPLKPIAKEPEPYISPNAVQHSMSPFYMSNENAHKRFMSGYTGFVPRSRGLLGMGYPIITHQALNEFTDDIKRIPGVPKKTAEVTFRGEGKPIYPVESGLVPHYTGHIP